MPQFFVAPTALSNGRAVLDEKESHHLKNVFSVKPGSEIDLFDGTSVSYKARVSGFDPKGRVEVEILSVIASDESVRAGLDIVLGQCVFQFARMDEMVRAVCELGAMRLLPVVSERSNFSEKQVDKHAERWERIVLSASKQCGRTHTMEIAPACDFDDAVEMAAGFDIRIYGSIAPTDDAVRLRESISESVGNGKRASVFVLVGPEGGLSQKEEESLSGAGFLRLNTSPHVLRAGTAAAALCAVCQYEAGAAKKIL